MVVAILNSVIKNIPEVFDCVNIWALSCSVQSIKSIATIPIHCAPLNMKASIAILEVTWVHTEELPQHRAYIVIQKSEISVGVKLTMNWDKGSHMISEKISPHHNFPSTEINCRRNAIWQEVFSRHIHYHPKGKP